MSKLNAAPRFLAGPFAGLLNLIDRQDQSLSSKGILWPEFLRSRHAANCILLTTLDGGNRENNARCYTQRLVNFLSQVIMHPALLWCALAFYGLGILLTLPSVIGGRPRLSPATLAALSLGLLLHATALITATIQLNHIPVTDVQSALSFFAFNVTLAFFLAYLRYRVTSLGVFMLPFVFVFTLLAAVHPDRSPSTSAFLGGWLLVHASSMILGYTGIFLTFVAALMYLIQENELKSKIPQGFHHRLPSLEVCVDLYDRSLKFGLLFLSIGILTGFIWASRAWEGPWELDPKILASLLTWLIYLTLLSTRVSGNWRGRRSAYGAILGFAATMVTFLGVSCLSGQHGYFPNLTHIP